MTPVPGLPTKLTPAAAFAGPSLGTRLHGQPFTAPVTQVSFLSLSHRGGNSGPEWLRLAISSQEAAGTAVSGHSRFRSQPAGDAGQGMSPQSSPRRGTGGTCPRGRWAQPQCEGERVLLQGTPWAPSGQSTAWVPLLKHRPFSPKQEHPQKGLVSLWQTVTGTVFPAS